MSEKEYIDKNDILKELERRKQIVGTFFKDNATKANDEKVLFALNELEKQYKSLISFVKELKPINKKNIE